MRRTVRGLVGLVGFLAVGEVVGRSGIAPPGYLPPSSVVLTRLVELLADRAFVLDLIATVLAWAIALGIAVAVAVPAGLLLGTVPALRHGAKAVVEFLRPIPSVALIPLAIMVFGIGPDTKISLAVYAAVWPILFNTIYAMDEVDPKLVDTARSFGLGRWPVLARVSLPSAAPFVATGIRLSAAVALIVVVSVEFLAGASGGLGRFILESGSGSGRMDLVFAGTVVAGLVGYLVNAGLEWAQRRLFAWSAAVGEAS
ncbi:ABC transporter permease [Streptoalloteichus hindustanus]|uniref:NitT/TauT family transport system permease protein n=1 Tax=Streptoalloteichus hindustanus TaxID=2017 RepID=A0A1M4WDB6_STRHI|nr:ABC transporter permease [Streptoalloteichus hindustanus]SHE78972.1 NitT/TauT family transport system permease protein [Streptoalloteichus hindustanus]